MSTTTDVSVKATEPPEDAPAKPKKVQLNARRATVVNLVLNLAVPLGLYYGLRALGVNQWLSLILSGIPPVVQTIRSTIVRRRIDGLALFTLSILVLSGVTSLITGSPRLLLAKDGWTTALAGLWFLATLFRKPFMYYILNSLGGPEFREKMAGVWEKSATYRRALVTVTAIWGAGLVLDAGVRVVLAYTLPVDQVPLISGLQYVVAYFILDGAGRLYFRRRSLRARIAAEAGQELGR